MPKIINTATELDALLSSNEPVVIEISTRKRTFAALLSGVKKDGRFDISVPAGEMIGDTDEPFEMTYHLDDVIVRFDA